MTESLGQAIRRLRLAADITLRGFAEVIEISAAHQSDIEHGRRMPSDDVLRRTAAALKRVGATYDSLRALDSRLGDDVQAMVQRNPRVAQLLRQVTDSRRTPDEVLKELQEFLRNQRKEE